MDEIFVIGISFMFYYTTRVGVIAWDDLK